MIVFIVTLSSYIGWKRKENNYNRQYVYSNYGILYYENNGDKTYVDKIYNTDNEVINLDIPDRKTVVMYCSKENSNECIFFDEDNSIETGMLNPLMNFVILLFLIAIGLLFIIDKRIKIDENGEERVSFDGIYMLYVFLFVFGTWLLALQIYNTINYFNLKNNSNVTTATIYLEIYGVNSKGNSYKPVSYYYVNDQKYIYVNDSYIKGSLENNIGTTFEVYYDKNNPNKVSKKKIVQLVY